MSSELETPSDGVDESEKKNYGTPERENHIKITDLSELLKEGTKESHDRAENTQFVKDFLKGHIKKDLFKLATTALYFTYLALEEEMERNKDHPAFAPLYFPVELHRTEALTKDMEYFFGKDWKEQLQCSEATQSYIDRIHYVGQHEPELLVAHAYTRYMGDLSGGQVLRKVAQRVLKLPSTGEGTQFYQFENIDNAQQFKQFYRARMNALDLDMKTKEKIVEEANRAFEYNMQIFNELDKVGSLLGKESQDGEFLHDGKGDVRKCPYYAAQQSKGTHESCACPFKTATAVLRQLNLQLFLAVLALVCGLIAWYFM
ncbi:heme oxygenase 2 [Monodelphis domestica]|uniref:heme oxygenase 2 n=1 Tax=Monodelphis domestica TaxID=13616 RepID=UPI00005E9A25|nr:heme oxygenase 2 [Monodelphis domestica]XP_007498819.1 heme oxygenase 2 [Monodelphis domestica]XP_056662070.1 heme oxygenase 2 [Monodelphis domestica]XP_056662071.1 heme oxygenase 2 [Monodelphis domestica]XP_056662072.1 heme oxygenase 2 [Monodelphis domestica]XP_056662073.1 heme oxygenase 2 [Monodelphis domestica]XP_056662074.1 heme oxygenase 2 [Monodelphis domestica]XP_056662075.1 heme oxygenase 2 [Monodelphis domestica]